MLVKPLFDKSKLFGMVASELVHLFWYTLLIVALVSRAGGKEPSKGKFTIASFKIFHLLVILILELDLFIKLLCHNPAEAPNGLKR